MDETLVQKLVTDGEDMTFHNLAFEMKNCHRYSALLGKGYKELERDLMDTVDQEFPGAIDWLRRTYSVNEGFDGNQIIPNPIKEKYVRCLLYADGHR